MYALLSRLWLTEPDAELLDSLASADVATALPEWFEVPSLDELENLRADFTQLFIGPKDQSPPYQSVWQEGQFEGSATGTMRTYFDVLGYEPEVVGSADGVMPDHVSVQFDTMRSLLEQAATKDDNEAAFVDLVASFFDDNLMWMPPLLGAVINRATTALYANIARLTVEFMHDEAERFGHAQETQQ